VRVRVWRLIGIERTTTDPTTNPTTDRTTTDPTTNPTTTDPTTTDRTAAPTADHYPRRTATSASAAEDELDADGFPPSTTS